MKSPSLILAGLSLSFVLPALADTFVLKDGTSLEGKILSETADSYHLEIQVTKSIKDEKTVAKADVKEIVREKVDETAFEKLKGLVPTPDLLTTDEYDRRILALNKFIKDYPKSAKVAEANTMLATLKTEGTAVQSGGVKLGGNIISGDDYKANAYELDARSQEARVRDLLSKGDIVGGLRGISRIEAEFGTTSVRTSLATVKRQALQSYKSQIADQLRTYEARVAERKSGLERMTGENRNTTEQAIAEEASQFKRRYQAEKDSQQVWTITDPFNRASLEGAREAISRAEQEVPREDRGDGGKAFRDAWSAIHSWDGKDESKDSVKEAFNKVKDLELPEKYVSILADAAKAKGLDL